MPYTLGLDLGTNSIGWALLKFNDKDMAEEITAAGCRIFQEAVEGETRTPKNAKRRSARLARRVKRRRVERKKRVEQLLIGANMLPSDDQERFALMNDFAIHPYKLRTLALDGALEPYQVGRAIYHLAQRRGFKSNRKALLGDQLRDDPDLMAVLEEEEAKKIVAQLARLRKRDLSEAEIAAVLEKAAGKDDDDDGVVLAQISGLKSEIQASGARTLGEFLHQEFEEWLKSNGENGRPPRKRFTDRAMYEQELEAIWNAQAPHHPRLSEGLKSEIYRAIFHQNPIKPPLETAGNCELEPQRHRASRALLISQEFRIWQTVNNIKVRETGSREGRRLTLEEMSLVAQALMSQREMKWGAFRKLLKFPKIELLEINFEQGGVESIIGNTTVVKVKYAIGDQWDALNPEKQRALVDDLLTIGTKTSLYKRLKTDWKFGPGEAYRLATLELDGGKMSFSVKAMSKILPYLKQGMLLSEACTAAGYENYLGAAVKGNLDKLPDPEDLRNPVVNRCLFEVRRVVNAIISKYGKPDVIRVEMLRDMKLTKKQKEKVQQNNKRIEALNKEAEVKFQEVMGAGSRARRADKIKYQLWKECGGVCPYTGKCIPLGELFSEKWDIEHILPILRSLDDSFQNKTLCDATENRLVKKNQTPFEAYSGDPAKYDAILARLSTFKDMGEGKKNKFRQEEIKLDDFVNRQFSDSAYIAKETKSYLAQLGVDCQVTKGGLTATLRHFWGLNSILEEETSEEEPKNGTDERKDGEAKKNRGDHRHHAIDAIVVALTNRSLLMKFSKVSAQVTSYKMKDLVGGVEQPLANLRDEVTKVVDNIIVSHQVTRKIVGALHEKTAYGKTSQPGKFVTRKALTVMTPKELSNIRDDNLRALVQAELKRIGKRDFTKDAPSIFVGAKQIPVRKVRFYVPLQESNLVGLNPSGGIPTRFHPKGNNHQLIIIFKEGEAPQAEIISTIDAKRRRNAVNAQPGTRVITLCKNDTVEVETDEGLELMRVVKFAAANPVDLLLRPLNEAGESSGLRLQSAKPLAKVNRAVIISPIGILE